MSAVLLRVLLVAVALTGGAAAIGAEPCRLRQVAEVVVTRDPDSGAIYIPVTLNGHPGLMALQLSGGLPYILPAYVDELGLKDRATRTDWDVSVRGKKVTQQAKVDSTILDRANFTGWDYLIYPADPGYRPSQQGVPIFGVMTSAFMNVVDLELNLGTGKLRMFRPNECKGMPVYWQAEVTGVDLFVDPTGLMLFPIEVEGQKFEGGLNTSSHLSVISSEATRRFLGFDEKSPGIERVPRFDGDEDATFRAMSLTAQGLDVRNARVRIKQMPTCKLSAANRSSRAVACSTVLALTPFSIGTDLMKQLRIFVSLRDKKIYFTRDAPATVVPAANPAGATPADGASAAVAPPDGAGRQ